MNDWFNNYELGNIVQDRWQRCPTSKFRDENKGNQLVDLLNECLGLTNKVKQIYDKSKNNVIVDTNCHVVKGKKKGKWVKMQCNAMVLLATHDSYLQRILRTREVS